MSFKVLVTDLIDYDSIHIAAMAQVINLDTNELDMQMYVPLDGANLFPQTALNAEIISEVISVGATNGYTLTADLVYLAWLSVKKTFNNAPARSIVSTAAAANGFQIDTVLDAQVSYSCTIGTTATIGGASSGTLVLEVAPTNSSVAGDWKEIARLTNGQTITLALALQSVQTIAGCLAGLVPAGYYARIRSINNSGTPTFTFNSGQEVKF